MQTTYLTERLSLHILEENSASMVLEFYKRNHPYFQPYAPELPNEFFTISYQEAALKAEYQLYLKSSSLRYYIFEADREDHVIGTVCFCHITGSPYNSCKLGYRIDRQYWKRGYAYETLSFLIPLIIKNQKIHRIELEIMPENTASVHLADCLGFSFEGIARDCCEISGKRESHFRYSLLSTDPMPKPYCSKNEP